jgi:hypothetical protein
MAGLVAANVETNAMAKTDWVFIENAPVSLCLLGARTEPSRFRLDTYSNEQQQLAGQIRQLIDLTYISLIKPGQIKQ